MSSHSFRAQLSWTLVVAAGWAHTTALAVFAYGAGGSAAVGLALLVRSAPAVLGAPLTGMAARLPLKLTLPLAGAVAAAALAASAVAVAAAAAAAAYALAAVVTLATMLFRQAHSALLPAVAGGRLTAANATATTIESVGMVAGPAAAGVLLALSSVPVVLGVAALTTAAAALVVTAPEGTGGERTTLLAGFREAAAQPKVRLVLALLLVQTVVSGALNVLFVVCAVELLELGRQGTSLLTVAFGAGGLIGGLAALGSSRDADLVAWLRVGLLLWGLPLVCLGLVPEPHLALGLIAAVGLGNALFDVASVTLVQHALSGAALARVLGVLETVVVCGLAAGAGAASLAVAHLGVRGALVAAGVILPLALVASHRPVGRLRPSGAPA
jgi:hypothetical protein